MNTGLAASFGAVAEVLGLRRGYQTGTSDFGGPCDHGRRKMSWVPIRRQMM
jgi:hypothetical protein